MPDTIWDAAMAAVGDRLAAQITDVPLYRDRRAAVGEAEVPCMVLTLSGSEQDLAVAAGEAFHSIEIAVTGYAKGPTDTAARIALSSLRARVIAALDGLQSGTIFDAQSSGSDLTLFDADQSARPAGSFTQTFSVLATTPAGSPYAP